MDETIDAEIQPTGLTFSAPGGTLIGIALSLLVALAVTGGRGEALLAIVLVITIPLIFVVYAAAHTPMATGAALDNGYLVVQDPNPWWKRLTGYLEERKLHLEIESIKEIEGGLLVTGRRWRLQLERYRIRLGIAEEDVDTVKEQLLEAKKIHS